MLSQTFKLVATYDGEPNAGVPTEFIAKFLNPDPAFSFFRMICGSQGMTSFQQEDWCYANEFYKKAGVRSVFLGGSWLYLQQSAGESSFTGLTEE